MINSSLKKNEIWNLITGQENPFIQSHLSISCPLHQEVVPAFLKLQDEARKDGFNLQIVSGYRDLSRQLKIWNEKAQSLRPLYDFNGSKTLDPQTLSNTQLLQALLRWSALPGTSRHHWGTDMDIYDGNKLPGNYKIQLIPEETTPEGIFGELHLWLDEKIERGESQGFYRPYSEDRGGVAPERWHLSYAPLATTFVKYYSLPKLVTFFSRLEIELKAEILQESFLTDFIDRYLNNVSPAPDFGQFK